MLRQENRRVDEEILEVEKSNLKSIYGGRHMEEGWLEEQTSS